MLRVPIDDLREILRLVRERKLARQPGLRGHTNDQLRQEAYRWAREHGVLRPSTLAQLAAKLGKTSVLDPEDPDRLSPWLVTELSMLGWTTLHHGWVNQHRATPDEHGKLRVFYLRPPNPGENHGS